MVFNIAGYRVLFNYLDGQAQAQMIEKLDNNTYSKVKLTEVKVALHLPYFISNKDFERYDGSIVLNGVTYNYVERKIENDTLILRCIPNEKSDDIRIAGSEYGKTVNDIQATQHGQKSNNSSLLLKSLECAAYKLNTGFVYNEMFFTTQLSAYKSVSEKIVNDRFVLSPEQPPDVI